MQKNAAFSSAIVCCEFFNIIFYAQKPAMYCETFSFFPIKRLTPLLRDFSLFTSVLIKERESCKKVNLST